MQFRSGPTLAVSKVFDSLLSEKILEREFLKRFSASTFDYYSGASKSVQHIRHFLDKTIVHSCNDALMCLTFLSSLKGVASDWFYSLLPHSLCNFEEVTEEFLTQYSSRQEAKKNKHNLISVKIRRETTSSRTLAAFRAS